MRRWLLLFCGLVLPGAASAEPAVFVARAPGITAYLLGSVHALPPELEWDGPTIRKAVADSGECWFEVVFPANLMLAMPAGTLLRGTDPGRTLSSQLSEKDARGLRGWVEHSDGLVTMAFMDTVRPWMAWMMLDDLLAHRTGMDPEHGADVVLQRRARAAGKRLVGLETIEQDIDMLAGLPEAELVAALHRMLDGGEDEAVDTLLSLVRTWQSGAVDELGRMVDTARRDVFTPAMDQALFTARNAAWAERLDGERGSGKTITVTVGAAHLAGTGNLRELLQGRGWTVERVKEDRP